MSSELKVQVLQSVQRLDQGKIVQRRMADMPTGSKVSGPVSVETDRTQLNRSTPDKFQFKEVALGNALPKSGEIIPHADSPNTSVKQLQSQREQTPSNDEVFGAVQELNDFVQNARREIHFSVDDHTGRTVVKVIDHQTKDVIRQIPVDEILEVARRMKDFNGEKGNLLKTEV